MKAEHLVGLKGKNWVACWVATLAAKRAGQKVLVTVANLAARMARRSVAHWALKTVVCLAGY